MPMYALATLPLSDRLPNNVTQVWYADDVCACRSIVKLGNWWDRLHQVGLGFGYNVNASKTWLVTKPSFHCFTFSQFSGSNVNITCDSRPYLGAVIGTQEFCKKFLEDRVKVLSAEVLLLAKIAEPTTWCFLCLYTRAFQQVGVRPICQHKFRNNRMVKEPRIMLE